MDFSTVQSWTLRIKRWAAEEQVHQHEDKLFLGLTLLIGAVVGLVIAAFILLTENLGARMYPAGGAAWRRLLLPTLGSLITGFLLFRYFPGARGSGIPQTKVALFLQEGFISFRTVLGRFGLSSISLASGIALGREGPSVQVGAGIASVLGRWLGLGPNKVKALIPIGASAALAAAFNTPVAAVLFTLEEVMGDMHAPVLGSIVLSSATSWIVLHLVLGDEPLFHVPSYQLVHPAEFAAYALLGVLGGLVSVGFVKLLLFIRRWFLGLPKWSVWFQPVAGGLLVGILGWFFPDVLGVGYSHVSQALNSQLAISSMLLLVFLKIVATSTCYSSGNAGGIFGPSLFIGAMLGGALGSGVHSLFPDYTGSAGAYALVGMGTAFAGIIRTPMTSVIMIFEVTRDYSIIVPLMISNLVSYFISYRLQPEPIYESLQHQEGIHLPQSVRLRERVLSVQQIDLLPFEAIDESTTVRESLLRMSDEVDVLPVVIGDYLIGIIERKQVQREIEHGNADASVARILPDDEIDEKSPLFPHVYPDDAVDTALRRMADAGIHAIPIVSRTNFHALVGMISVRGILDGYGIDGKKGKRPVEECDPRTSAAPRGLVIGLVSAAVMLMMVIAFLSYHYRAVRQERAKEDSELGKELQAQGRASEAVEQYRNALSASPGSAQYRLALGMALIDAGNPAEAEVYLTPLLNAQANDGPANLAMGRSRAHQNKPSEAQEYYHRAIYGVWPANASQEKLRARFELVDYLEQVGASTQAVSELLAVPEEAPKDIAALQRAGDTLLKLGSARQSTEVFQRILHQDDRNSHAYQGIGLAHMSLGNYPASLGPLREAVKWNPLDDKLKLQLRVAEDVVALNPAARGLSGRDRYRRSQLLLKRSVSDLENCITLDRVSPELKPAQELVATARAAFARTETQQPPSDALDRNIALVEQLRDIRKRLCVLGGADDEALDNIIAVMAK